MKRKLKDDNIIKICFAIAITFLLLVALIIISSAMDNYTISEQTGEKLYHLPNGVTDTDEWQRVSNVIVESDKVSLIDNITSGVAQYILFNNVVSDNVTWSDSTKNIHIDGKIKLSGVPNEEQTNNTYRAVGNKFYLYFPINTFTTLQDAKEWANANPLNVIYELVAPVEKPNLQTRIAKHQSTSIINGIANGIKNIALAISKTITEFFYLSNEITTRGHIFITLLVATMALTIIGLIIKR